MPRVKLLKLIFFVLAMSCCLLTVAHAITFVILTADLSIDKDVVTTGESVTINIGIESTGSRVATNPGVTILMPPGSSDISSPDCTPLDQTTLFCGLAEIGIDEVAGFSISAVLSDVGHYLFTAVLNADDLLGGAQTETKLITVMPQSENTEPEITADPVDLELTVRKNGGDNNEIKIDGFGYVTAVVRNSHPQNTAFFPVVDLQLSDSLRFHSGDYCTESDDNVVCKVPTLAPQSEAEFVIALHGIALGEGATFTAVASSTQEDLQSDDNTAGLVFEIVKQEVLCGASNPTCSGGPGGDSTGDTGGPDSVGDIAGDTTGTEQPTGVAVEPEQATGSDAGSSGGGAISVLHLLCLLLLCMWRRDALKNNLRQYV